MKLIKIFLFNIIIVFIVNQTVIADTPFFLDFKYVLNESDAGKKAQNYLKSKLEKGIKDLKSKEKKYKRKKKKL